MILTSPSFDLKTNQGGKLDFRLELNLQNHKRFSFAGSWEWKNIWIFLFQYKTIKLLLIQIHKVPHAGWTVYKICSYKSHFFLPFAFIITEISDTHSPCQLIQSVMYFQLTQCWRWSWRLLAFYTQRHTPEESDGYSQLICTVTAVQDFILWNSMATTTGLWMCPLSLFLWHINISFLLMHVTQLFCDCICSITLTLFSHLQNSNNWNIIFILN